jgi:DNA-binding winged helix-turn-helix (wHTH) protein
VKVRFGPFTLDSASRRLLRDGNAVHLPRKAFEGLSWLVERRPDAVTKGELHARLWPGTFVSDANLSVVIAEIRRALGDDPQSPRYIRTVHRVGYAFCAGVDETAAAAPGPYRAWLVWNDRVLPLVAGENVIGRDPASAVWIDVAGVSRRHASIRIDGDTATVADLDSTNGTSVSGASVIEPRRLAANDRVRIGPVELEFRTSDGTSSAETVRLTRKG